MRKGLTLTEVDKGKVFCEICLFDLTWVVLHNKLHQDIKSQFIGTIPHMGKHG